MLQGYERGVDRGVEVCFTALDRAFASDTAFALRDARRRVSAYFGRALALPPVRAILAPDRDEFDRLVADLLHVEIERPSDPRRIAQTQKTDIVFLSPSAYAAHSAYAYLPGDFRRMLWHETVHVVEEHVSPSIESSPLWWSEGLAVYLSGQWRHESQFRFREPVLEAVGAGRVPPFAEVVADRSLAYAFGWTLIGFIDQERGRGAVIRVVREMHDGDVLAVLGEDAERFEARWRAWLTASGGGALHPHT